MSAAQIGSVAGVAIVTVVLAVLLRPYSPVYALLASLAGTVVLLAWMLPYAAQALEWMETFSPYLRGEEFLCLVRAAGIALVAQTAQDLCKDAGMTAMGAKVELAGRCMILLSALPMLRQVVDVWSRLLR